MSAESLEQFRADYLNGKDAFDRGRYREAVQYLQAASQRVDRNSRVGGEVQMWLVSAYQAAGDSKAAIALCKSLMRHPHLETRKQAKRLAYVLEAPQLQTRREWLLEIPDMSALDEGGSKVSQIGTNAATKKPKRQRPESEISGEDLTQINTQENGFVWLAIVAIVALLGGLVWLS